MQASLADPLKGFAQSFQTTPDAIAVEFSSYCQSYKQIHSLARQIVSACSHDHQPFVGLWLAKSRLTYAGVIGIIGAAKAYIPIHSDFPESRIRMIIEQSGLETLIVGQEQLKSLLQWAADTLRPIKWLIVENQEQVLEISGPLMQKAPGLQILAIDEQQEAPWKTAQNSAPAYVLFTSGSTGIPKGIIINRGNLNHYLQWALPQFPLQAGDRCTQTFDLSFDLSVHDIFVTLSQGATLVIPDPGDLLFPNNYLAKRSLTSWFSVPSLAVRIKQLRLLAEGSLPKLRYAYFCGEGLPQEIAASWAKAAPSAHILNLYGPTEATIACTYQVWQAEASKDHALVPIGKAFPSMTTTLHDESSHSLIEGSGIGELWLAGPQLADGYLKDAEKTASAFVTFQQCRWYRTGDLVERDDQGVLHFKGRIDFQVKIRGYRIELGEIEKILYRVAPAEFWIALPWPAGAQQAQSIIAVYISREPLDEARALAACQNFLPQYMIPERLIGRNELPLNSNGKVDRKMLASQLT